MAADFTIVIPTAFRVGGREIAGRAMALVRFGAFRGQELIFSHGSYSRYNDRRFCRALESTGVRVVQTQLKSDQLPLSLLRNRGAQVATGKHILFWDVDLVPSASFLSDLLQWLDSGRRPFAIIPSLYATRLGTRKLVKDGWFDIGQALAAFYGHRRDWIAHLALNTSTVAIARDHYDLSGGFDERFIDHGLEDFDFLLRLASKDNSLPIPTDLLTDVRHQSPAFCSGFRAVLNLISLPVFLDGIVTLHQWHRRLRTGSYYERRRENLSFFEENVRVALGHRSVAPASQDWKTLVRADGTLDSVLAVHSMVRQAKYPPLDPSALFDEVPQHYFHRDRIQRRLLRLLMGAFRHGTGGGRRKTRNS
jgi:predicted glycosyltransferase involved in capsule biosynthesis